MLPSITPQDLATRLAAEDDDLVLLDCREALELQIARIDGALHIPMQEIPGRLDELDREQPYAVICHHGVRSSHVVAFLAQQGFGKCLNVVGGIDAYARFVDRSIPIY
ncbi:MAG: rhodanese-like domain-containing protein [Planctomycetota bacterium]|nr:rhodanese-like domain-containing protein [Planctomycetota bacterium]